MPYETYSDARRALGRGETSCEALVSSFLARIDERNEALNALLSVDREGAINHARYLDSQRARGHSRPLAGLVLVLKDTISLRGERLTCGSRILEGFSAVYDATVVERLREAGAIFIGKANCDEFGMGSSNETSHFGSVRHPQDAEYVPGGSSGGSAAAVAAGFCHAALGSDTGGSVRQPAAFCGVVGLKPTYGRVSRYGLAAYASSLDTIGPMGRSVEDTALLLKSLAGADPNDATSASVEVPDYEAALGAPIEDVRVGLPAEYFGGGLDAGVRQAIDEQVDRLKEAGADVREVSLPHTDYGVAAYYLIAPAEASSNLARYDGVRYGHRADLEETDGEALEALYARSRTEGFGAEVKRRLMLGTYVLSAGYYDRYYAKAQRVRTLIKDDFARVFEKVDVLLTPTTPTTPFQLGSKEDPLQMYQSDVYTVPASLAGLPALSVPAGTHPEEPHLPVGLQLIGRHFDEALLLQVGDAVMQN